MAHHWKLSQDDNNIAWLCFDKADSTTNVLSCEVIEELDGMLSSVEALSPSGLIIRSTKTSGFCAGADVEEFTKIKTRDEAHALIRRAQTIFDRLENLPCPTLCLIHGFCLGGGMELALACNYRIAQDDPNTRMGLPEIKLGIHPGFAGSVRLTRLIGAPAAMPLILAGRTFDARTAKKLGVISFAVAERLLESAATQFILKPPAKPHARGLKALTNSIVLRPLLASIFRSSLKKKVRQQHYPAPFAQIRVWEKYGGNPEAMTLAEADSVAELIMTPTAQNLIRLFFLQNRLKGLSKESEFKAKHVHVIGAGVMGGDIAAWCALKGMKVTLQDRTASAIAPAIKRAHALFMKRLKIPREVQHAHDRLIPDLHGDGLRGADVIIEAIFEDLEIKQQVFKDVENLARPDAVLATNTSSLRIEAIARALQSPPRLVGIHFFNPVAKMLLVEIVQGNQSDPEFVTKATAFTKQLGKLPLPVKSSPGFLVNRILMPYLLESVRALEDGIPGPVIDKAARNFGMPMGPIELADAVGLDICLHVADILASDLGTEVPAILKDKVQQGLLGQKTGQGFYRYSKGRKTVQSVKSSQIPDDLTDRLILRLINEAVQCLHEGIVDDPDLMDAGVVFGTGFAPFLGGPMQYTASRGVDEVQKCLQELQQVYGDRFTLSKGW